MCTEFAGMSTQVFCNRIAVFLLDKWKTSWVIIDCFSVTIIYELIYRESTFKIPTLVLFIERSVHCLYRKKEKSYSILQFLSKNTFKLHALENNNDFMNVLESSETIGIIKVRGRAPALTMNHLFWTIWMKHLFSQLLKSNKL